jgi:hypothetical protein
MFVPFPCNFFRGLSLALWSHDQFKASHWSNLPPPPKGDGNPQKKTTKKTTYPRPRGGWGIDQWEAGIWLCDLRANERPWKKSHGKGTSRQRRQQTDIATTRPTRPRGPSWWKSLFIYSHSCLPLMNSHALTKPAHHLTPARLPLLPLSVLVTLQTPPNYLIFSHQPFSQDIPHSIQSILVRSKAFSK